MMPSAWQVPFLSNKPHALALCAAVVSLLATAPNAAAQQQVTHGRRGFTVQHAVVNFAELARQEKLHPPAPARKRAIPLMRGPKFTVPPGAISPAAPRFEAAAPAVGAESSRPLSPPL